METSRRNSVVLWILLGVVLILVSYVLTIALAVGCIALVLTGNVIAAIGGVILGLTILWSLIPRRDKFEAPGPVLNRQECPHLFAELDRIASDLKEEMPAEVYLIPQMNAWVAERGGVMGFGRRRVMGIGLPCSAPLQLPISRCLGT